MTETFFGDFDLEDAYDTEPADPVQVARKLHGYRVILEQLAGRVLAPFDNIGDDERADLTFVGQRIVNFVHEHVVGDGLAEAIHEAGRERSGGPRWDDLSDEHRRFAIAFAMLIGAWLLRQGAWR
jgi:hypothetical protein